MNRRGRAAEKALKALLARKWGTPSAVMVLEALSKTLPDNAHLTELRIAGGEVQNRWIGHRRAGPHSVNRAVATFHQGYVLRPYGEGSKRR
jgi:HEPN domain-containing protein